MFPLNPVYLEAYEEHHSPLLLLFWVHPCIKQAGRKLERC